MSQCISACPVASMFMNFLYVTFNTVNRKSNNNSKSAHFLQRLQLFVVLVVLGFVRVENLMDWKCFNGARVFLLSLWQHIEFYVHFDTRDILLYASMCVCVCEYVYVSVPNECSDLKCGIKWCSISIFSEKCNFEFFVVKLLSFVF